MSYFRNLLIIGLVLLSVSCKSSDVEMYQSKMKDPSNPVVKMETTNGDIYIELFQKEAPVTVKNFIAYVNSGFYSNTVFHRVIKGFVIQGGGFATGMNMKKTYPPIQNEAGNGLKNKRGTLSMARTNVINSGTSQFFVNLVDNRSLDHTDNTPRGYGYAVFAEVISGMEVVDKISDTETKKVGYFSDVPKDDIFILKATLLNH